MRWDEVALHLNKRYMCKTYDKSLVKSEKKEGLLLGWGC